MIYKMKNENGTRKELAKAIEKITAQEAKYMGVPSCGYKIGDMVLDKDWNLEVPDGMDAQELLLALTDLGFYEPKEKIPAKPEEEPTQAATAPLTGLVVKIPLSTMTTEAIINLTDLLIAKDRLLCHAFGIEDLDLIRTEENIEFRWFDGMDIGAEEANAYMTFISKLCDLARTLKRVNGKEKEVPNEKYAFRCFLLRLGFVGKEYKEQRKILLSKLSGSSAFRDGRKKDEVSE